MGYAELKRKSFLFIPFTVESNKIETASIHAFADLLKKESNQIWHNMDDAYPYLPKDKLSRKGVYNTRYMLDYVAGRIGCCEDEHENKICIQSFAYIKDIISSGRTHTLTSTKAHLSFEDTEKYESFELQRAFLFCFSTSINLLVIEISFSHEADYLKMANTLFQMKNIFSNNINIDGVGKERYNLADVSSDILNGIDGLKEMGDICFAIGYSHANYQRQFTLTYYETTDLEANELEKAMFVLSHCYNADMIPDNKTDDTCKIYRNNNVCRWGGTSGAAACITFVNQSTEKFITAGPFRYDIDAGYLLIFALLLNQKYRLYQLLSRIGRELDISDRNIDACYKFRDELYDFEQNYNFRVVTELPQYQNVYDILYGMFRIDQLLEDVRDPLEAINSILTEKQYEEEKRLKEIENEERRKAEEKENENDRIANDSLAIISFLAIFSALVDSWDFIGKIALKGEDGIARNYVQFAFFILIVVVFAIALIRSKLMSRILGIGKLSRKNNKAPNIDKNNSKKQ